MEHLRDTQQQQQAILNYIRLGAVSCRLSGTREQLSYHSEAKHALSQDGREQLLSHILEMEAPDMMHSSSCDGSQRSNGRLSWSNDFQLLPLSKGHRNFCHSSRESSEQQQQVVAARGFARGEVLGFVLGCMMPASDAEQLLLSAASPEEALQVTRLSFSFELAGESKQQQQQQQQQRVAAGGGSGSERRCVSVVAAGFLNGNPLAQVLDYRQLGPYCQVLGPGAGSPNAALLPVSHNRTGKVYLAVVAVCDITAGTEVTFDCGTASYASRIDAVLRCCLSSNQQQLLQIKQRLEQQEEKLKAIKTTAEHQQQQMKVADAQGLPVCPVPAGNDVPAGKLHKSLMSQLLAALATCRKLPASSAQRSELDKLLQQAVTLAHEAVGLWPSAAATVQQQQQAGSGLAVRAVAAAGQKQEAAAAAESSALSGASSTPSAPRTPTFAGFLEVAAAADNNNKQQHTHQGPAAAVAGRHGIHLTSFGSAGSCESVSAAGMRPSRWSHSISAAVEVPPAWQQQGDGQEAGCGDDAIEEGGEVCAGSVQANVQPLVRQLISQHKYMQRLAANAIMNMAYDCADSRGVIAEAGAIPPLVAMLKLPSRSCQAAASGALSNLCIENMPNQAAIAALGGIQLLTGLLSSKSGAVQRSAARALNNLAWDIDNRAVIAAAGGIPSLVRLLASSCADVQEHAAAALMNMARDIIYGIPVAIAAAGGIPALVSLLRLDCSAEVQDSAAGALMNLAYSTPSNRAAIHAAGGIGPLVALLSSSSPFVRRSAAGALKNCSRESEENQAAIVAAGGIPLLVALLKGDRDDARFEAGGALWNLVHNSGEHLAELAAAGGVPDLAALMSDQPQ
uniref:Vacuolar protein 8 n=1 Tax=Tetradesmus obliquus TaxID=3088 RepID=A0A383VBQ7_TETOB|eukprot:jgi/Sobl393_1/11512/SZX62054.1